MCSKYFKTDGEIMMYTVMFSLFPNKKVRKKQKYNLLKSIFGAIVFFNSLACQAMDSSDDALAGLAVAQRPLEAQRAIDAVYSKVNKDTKSDWKLNGDHQYGLADIDEHRLIPVLINTAPESQKDFYVMDFGAGNFQLCEAIAKHIGTQKFDRKFRLHIVGVRGEQYLEQEVTELPCCTVHRYGSFKIENFRDSMRERGLQNVLFDLVISRSTWLHLLDQTGDFQDVYNSLRPETGLMITDDIKFNTSDNIAHRGYGYGLTDILEHANIPYLVDIMKPYYCTPEYGFGGVSASKQFVLRRPSSENLRLPFLYASLWKKGEPGETVLLAALGEGLTGRYEMPDRYRTYIPPTALFGSQELYNWLRLNECFLQEREYIGPLTR